MPVKESAGRLPLTPYPRFAFNPIDTPSSASPLQPDFVKINDPPATNMLFDIRQGAGSEGSFYSLTPCDRSLLRPGTPYPRQAIWDDETKGIVLVDGAAHQDSSPSLYLMSGNAAKGGPFTSNYVDGLHRSNSWSTVAGLHMTPLMHPMDQGHDPIPGTETRVRGKEGDGKGLCAKTRLYIVPPKATVDDLALDTTPSAGGSSSPTPIGKRRPQDTPRLVPRSLPSTLGYWPPATAQLTASISILQLSPRNSPRIRLSPKDGAARLPVSAMARPRPARPGMPGRSVSLLTRPTAVISPAPEPEPDLDVFR